MAERTPTDRAKQTWLRATHAYDRLRDAWGHRPTGNLTAAGTRTGPVTGGDRSDPTLAATAAHEHARLRIARTLATATLELADDLEHYDSRPRHVGGARPLAQRRIADILAVHRQWLTQLHTEIRRLDAMTTGYDQASRLCTLLDIHTNALHRLSWHAWGQLAQPPAPPGTRVCDDPGCQRALGLGEADLCDICTARRERAAARREADEARARHEAAVAARQLAADRTAGIVCAGEIRPDCDRPISAADRSRNAANCGACRKHGSLAASNGVAAFAWRTP